MPPKGKADLAHPQAADWVMGTLGPDEVVGFKLHLRSCPHCQAAVAEFSQLGQMLQHMPPAAEPPPGLEARTIASVLAAAADDQQVTEIQPAPEFPPLGADSPPPAQLAETPSAPPETRSHERSGDRVGKVIRFPRWNGRTGLLGIAGAVAAAVIAAVVILPGRGGSIPAGAVAFSLSSPTGQAASGSATARPDASGSWNITLKVQHLKNIGEEWHYECWYVGQGRRQVVSAGTFIVSDDGNGTFSMTSAVDPHQFRTMEIVAESPSSDGAIRGTVVLSGQAKL
jgi:hypothetical protein